MTVTARQLRAAEARVQKSKQAQAERDALIRQALSEGWTQRQIAEATGITHGRIGQIATGRR